MAGKGAMGRAHVGRRMAVERGEPARHAWREWNERDTLQIKWPDDIDPPSLMRLRATHVGERGDTVSSSHVHAVRGCIAHPAHQREVKTRG